LSSKNAAVTISPFPFLARTIVVYYITDGLQEAIGDAGSNCPYFVMI